MPRVRARGKGEIHLQTQNTTSSHTWSSPSSTQFYPEGTGECEKNPVDGDELPSGIPKLSERLRIIYASCLPAGERSVLSYLSWSIDARTGRTPKPSESWKDRPRLNGLLLFDHGVRPVIEVRVNVQVLDRADIPTCDKLTILRGQLTLLRMRAERGIPISIECIARAEKLAQSLESGEMPD